MNPYNLKEEYMSKHQKGLLLAMAGPVFWGLNSIAVKILLELGINSAWFATFRLITAGVLILIFAYFTEGSAIFRPFHHRQSLIQLLVFSIVGMFSIQYAYIMAIHFGNAATATVLQFTNPIMIVIFLALVNRRWPRHQDVISIFMAVIGTFLLATHGRIGELAMSNLALAWGLITAVATVFYTLLPQKLIDEFGSVSVSGWAMFIAGIFANFIHPVWQNVPTFTPQISSLLIFSIVLGTAFAYMIFIQSLAWISPTTASTLGAIEPLIATILTVAFFHVDFGWIDFLGALLIISTVFIQALKPKDQLENKFK